MHIYLYIYVNWIKGNKKCPSMSTLQSNFWLNLDIRNVDQHTGGNWLIHGTDHRKGDQSQSLDLPYRTS